MSRRDVRYWPKADISWCTADDYDVRLGDAKGKVVGRIFISPQAPKDRPWFWTITETKPRRPTDRGYVASREAAMAEFKRNWDAGSVKAAQGQ